MKIYDYSVLGKKEIQNLCQRQGINFENVIPMLETVKANIQKNGDQALRQYTAKFDGVKLDSFAVLEEEFEEAEKLVSDDFKKAIQVAYENIYKFHSLGTTNNLKIETTKGVTCWRETRAIEKVGLYIPGGTAPLFSTLLMTGVPAQIAGCDQIILCTPPQNNSKIAPEILYTARLLGLPKVYKIGGSQAIFGMAIGTETIEKVDKIFGPGNQYVTTAKMMVSQSVAIDMPAGPSELLVIADSTSNARFVASDLLSQAEHGGDSEVVLVCDDEAIIGKILSEVELQLEDLPRKEIAKEALSNSFAVLVKDKEAAFEFSNLYSPEHLILAFDEFGPWTDKIKNAGSVFCGRYTGESFGDYASGTNHVLPTSGFARNFSGVSVDSFIKKITFQEVTKEGVENLGPTVEILAEREELIAHKRAVSVRMGRE